MAVHAPAVAVPASSVSREDADNWTSPALAQGNSPPRVNPYHYIHNPGSDELLPPLPSHLARLANGEANSDDEADSDTSDESDSDDDEYEMATEGHGQSLEHARMSRDTRPSRESARSASPSMSSAAVLAQSTPAHILTPEGSPPSLSAPTAVPAQAQEKGPRRIMKKVSAVFRRNDNGDAGDKNLGTGISPNRQRSPIMQGPPPSPPLSDASEDDYASSVAVTEATVELPPAPGMAERSETPDTVRNTSALLMPVTEAGESRAALGLDDDASPRPPDSPTFTISLTSEPDGQQDLRENNFAVTTSPASQRRALSRERSGGPPFLGVQQQQRRVSSGSTSSRTGALAMVRSGRLAPQRDASPAPVVSASASPEPPIRSTSPLYASSMPEEPQPLPSQQQQLLRTPLAVQTFSDSHDPIPFTQSPSSSPSSLRPPRIQRRNTNPTVSTSPLAGRPLTHSISNSSHIPTVSGGQYDDFNLPADILAQTELIRLERLERRQKKLSLLGPPAPGATEQPPAAAGEAKTATPVAGPSTERKMTVRRKETEEQTRVLVGNLVGEGHRNYVLMYNMLTGIRVAVSRCQGKINRPITDEDYLARHKYTFDMLGNELTPSARYDFKFKDYAPWVFRELREVHFHLDPADYLLSLTAKYILSEIGSPGKSGSFFYYSRDYRFIIKTISHNEHNFLRSILKDYHEHVRANPHTLLSRFYGLHRVKMPRGRKIHFVIMNNLFPPHRDIHETYDLKGSSYGREYPEEKAKVNPRAVLKDKNWVNRGRMFEFGPEKRALLTEQLRRDMEFLRRINVMDYSLLVGIHNMERGNCDKLRETTLAVFHPDTKKNAVYRKPSSVKTHAEANNVRRAVARSDPKRMLDAGVSLPADGPMDRRHFLFYQDEGGLRATDEQNQPLDMVYYLGVIDICTPYNMSKRVEHAWKSVTENSATISCVDPVTYGHRFFDFLQSVMRGGDPALRPQGLEPPLIEVEKPVGSHGPVKAKPHIADGQASATETNGVLIVDIPKKQGIDRTPPGPGQVAQLNPIATQVGGAVVTSYSELGYMSTSAPTTSIIIDRGDGLPPGMVRVAMPLSPGCEVSDVEVAAANAEVFQTGTVGEMSEKAFAEQPYDRSAVVGHLKAE